MIPLLVFSGLFVSAIALVLLLGIRHAVDGYEDETGFHAEEVSRPSGKASVHPSMPAASAVAGKSN